MTFFTTLTHRLGNALRIKSAPEHTSGPPVRAAEPPAAPADAPIAPTSSGE